MSTVDISALVAAPVGSLATEYERVPEGVFMATIDAGDPNEWIKVSTRDNGETTVMLVVPFELQDENLKTALGRQKVMSRMTIFLDLIPGTVQLDTGKGKNVGLGQLREALGQNNDPNWTFNSLPGAGPVMAQITHRVNKQDGRIFDQVNRVTKLAT